MNMTIKALLIVCFLAVFAYAAETVQEFSFKTVEGKTIEYRATNRAPYVVNIGAHW
jgi:uncharacterized membrane protein